jgi:hypothetical protein
LPIWNKADWRTPPVDDIGIEPDPLERETFGAGSANALEWAMFPRTLFQGASLPG